MRALTAFLPWKIAAAFAYLASLFAYLAVEQFTRARAHTVPFTVFDQAIPIIPALVPVYLVQLIVVGLPFLFIEDFRRWQQAVSGLTAVAAISFACYLIYPTGIEQYPSISTGLSWMSQIDLRANALPSLHAACAIYVALLMHSFGLRTRWLMLVWAWTILVLFSCVSLREHTILDILCGAALGAAVAMIANRKVL